MMLFLIEARPTARRPSDAKASAPDLLAIRRKMRQLASRTAVERLDPDVNGRGEIRKPLAVRRPPCCPAIGNVRGDAQVGKSHTVIAGRFWSSKEE